MIGSMIGSYRILDKLGEGGMGVVYKAVDTGLDRLAAIKVLGADLSKSPELVERFRAEAKAQANLNHTNLATLYAFLVHEDRAFIAMEFVDGETFAQMIYRRGPIPEQEAIPLFRQALLGIGYAHRAGIIHRDIKPSNLMLNKNGIVKVMDFGIAKVMGTRGLTRTGTQMGTVAYMSPEQITNRGVDIRSDIYELGVTLYEMLTGRLPFESDSDFQIMQDHVSKAPPVPSRFYPYISKGVERVILKSLEKNPDARFQTVEEFGAAFEHPDSLSDTPSATARETPMVAAHGTVPVTRPFAQGTHPMNAPPTLPATVAVVQAGTLPLPRPPDPIWAQKKWMLGGVGVLLVVIIGVAIYQMNRPIPGPPPGPSGSTTHQDSPAKTTQDTGKTYTVDSDAPDSSPPSVLPPASKPASEPARPAPKPSSGPSRPAPHANSPSLSAAQMYQNAQTALSQRRFFEPVNNSAFYWAIQARKAGSPEGRALENQMLEVYRNQMNEYKRLRNYQGAIALVKAVLQFYPGDPGLLAEQKRLQAAMVASR